MKLRRLIFILILLIFIGFTACNDRPIFSVIEQEIDLKKFSVEGNVLSLLQAGDYVYASNLAGVYSKEKSSDGSWSKILSAPGTQKLAKDGTNVVFACFASGSVKYYESGSWKDVPDSENIRIIAGNKIVFGYDDSKKEVLKIVKDAAPSTVIHSGEVNNLSAAGNYVLVKSGSSTKLYKYGTPAEVPNLPDGAKAICPADTDNEIFVLAGSTIHYYNGSAWSSNTKSISDKTPISISYFKERKTILVGCTNGYTEVKLNTPINLSNATPFNPGNSGSTTPPGSYSQYQATLGSYPSLPILGVERGIPGSGKYAVFMGIHAGGVTRNTGLWGFYSDKKREWNRE